MQPYPRVFLLNCVFFFVCRMGSSYTSKTPYVAIDERGLVKKHSFVFVFLCGLVK